MMLCYWVALPPPVLNARLTTGAATLQKRLIEATRVIKQAYIEVPNHEIVIPKLLEFGVTVHTIHITILYVGGISII
jgi:hypothetical protein